MWEETETSKRRQIFHKIKKDLVDTTAEYVEDEEVPHGWIFYVVVAALEDEDNAPTTIAFGKKIGDVFIPFEEEDSPAAGISYHTERTHHFIPGDKPGFRVEGGTSGDALRGFVEGYYEEI